MGKKVRFSIQDEIKERNNNFDLEFLKSLTSNFSINKIKHLIKESINDGSVTRSSI